jgi:hypothetical protein
MYLHHQCHLSLSNAYLNFAYIKVSVEELITVRDGQGSDDLIGHASEPRCRVRFFTHDRPSEYGASQHAHAALIAFRTFSWRAQ